MLGAAMGALGGGGGGGGGGAPAGPTQQNVPTINIIDNNRSMIGPTGGGGPGGAGMNLGGLAPGLGMSMPGLPTSMPGITNALAQNTSTVMSPIGIGMPIGGMQGIHGAMTILPRFGYRPGMPRIGMPGLLMA